ncbi:MAG: hypothetical protein PVH95_03045 [Anaerolineae bacterium]|jgi:hypothetical protein
MPDVCWAVLSCPYRCSVIHSTDRVEWPIGYIACGQQLALTDRIPALLRREDVDSLAAFSQACGEEQLREVRIPLSPEQPL